ncbi:MAG: response regulator transcription factor [Propionicimonas sp.]|uniref:response regulator n=1 Tax=Propionicimonas sp. TaxID=1955623 RepID=UPI003D0D9B44
MAREGRKLRIGIVDDHPAIILGTTAMLNSQPDMYVIASAQTPLELLTWRQRLDVILLDLVLEDGSSPEANITMLAPLGASVIAFTSGDRADLIRRASRAGAAGMIRKTESASRIAEIIRTVARGEVAATPDWADALDSDQEFVTANLTKREAEVLALYASGETAERVAAILVVSRETVYDHIRRIRAKYAAADRAAPTKVDLFRRAVEDGIVPNDA